MTTDSQGWDFFLAHAGPDREPAEHLYEMLSRESRVFLDSKCLELGDDWDEALRAAQDNSSVSVLLISKHTTKAYYQREEIAAAVDLARQVDRKHRVVPVHLPDADSSATDVPYGLRLKHGIRMTQLSDLSGVAERLLALHRSLRGGTFKTHRDQLKKRAAGFEWWTRPIHIMVRQQGDPQGRDARDALRIWLASEEQHCTILGSPGAGKTGLLWWVASLAAERKNTVTMLVSAARLHTLNNPSMTELALIADPPFQLSPNRAELLGKEVLLLLDGLDELIGPELQGERHAAELLAKVMAAIPASTRVVSACRGPVFGHVENALRRTLPNRRAVNGGDEYDGAIERVLGAAGRLRVFTIQALPVAEARSFLVATDLGRELIDVATASSHIKPFLSTPFALKLLRRALPELAQAGSLTLVDLYEKYLRIVFFRDAPSLSDEDIDAILDKLSEASASSLDRIDDRTRSLLVSSGLVLKGPAKHEFSHYSFWEYFFSLNLLKRLRAFDSTLLATLDLVSGYNINRMLVPMVLRCLNGLEQTTCSSVRVPSSAEYHAFLRRTGWRKRSGYGIHPSMTRARDGTPAATFAVEHADAEAIHRDGRHGEQVASSVSWYDAAAFAMSVHACLPTSEQLRGLKLDGDYLIWSSDWHNEELSHVLALETRSGKMVGINPDVRLARTAIAICDER